MEFSANERILPPLQRFSHRKCTLRPDNLADDVGIKPVSSYGQRQVRS